MELLIAFKFVASVSEEVYNILINSTIDSFGALPLLRCWGHVPQVLPIVYVYAGCKWKTL